MNINNADPLDQVTLVDENDTVIGEMDKVEAHRGKANRHRAISVYLFRRTGEQENGSTGKRENSSNSQNTNHLPADVTALQAGKTLNTELLIQKRSAKKIVGAQQWANTVCGNVRPTESYEQCAYRRLQEELGITKVKIKPIYKFEYHLQINQEFSEWEIDQVFIGWYDGEVKPHSNEVSEYAWVDWRELGLRCQASGFSKFKSKDISTKNLESRTQHLSPIILLAPWFAWMLEDAKLVSKINMFLGK